MTGQKETHVSEAKKAKVKELAELMKKKTVMVISIKGLPSAQFQEIKKKLRDKAKIQVVKKSLVNFALDHSGIKELHELVPYVKDSTAMLFSDDDAFEISSILADEKSPAKAKAGQIAPKDIEVKAGPTDLLPGPDISALSAVGLAPKVEDGKIAIMQDKIIAKEGDVISPEIASIMAKLDIIPFEVGVEPVAAFDGDEKKIYIDIKIDKAGMIAELEDSFGRAVAFATELGIINDLTLDFIIGKAGVEEQIIDSLIDAGANEEKEVGESEEKVKEEKKDDAGAEVDKKAGESEDEKKEEVKAEEKGEEKDNAEEVKASEEKE